MNLQIKHLLLAVLALTLCRQLAGQPCINGISTNPYNPVNDQFVPMMNQWYPESQYPGTGTDTHNPFLNTHFNWYIGGGTIFLYPGSNAWSHQWSGNPDSVAMLNPYSGSMGSEFSYLRPDSVAASNRDFRWEDGWELLWMNMGYYPDGNSILQPAAGSYYSNHHEYYDPLPSDIPYFILYNRYRGLMRVIANVWYDHANYQNVEVVLKFPESSKWSGNLTGILRHASAIDLPLDQYTEVFSIHSPRYRLPNLTGWMVADFQMAYDPCTCISRGELQLEFIGFNSLNVDIVGRSISVDQPITQSNYKSENFLNLSNMNLGTYEPGTEVYQKMDDLMDRYQTNLHTYHENLEAYNAWNNNIVRKGMGLASKYLTGGLANIIIGDSLITWLYKQSSDTTKNLIHISETDTSKFDKKLTDGTKKALGEGFDFLTAQIFGPKPDKPRKPTFPVASYEESVYKGTISRLDTASTSPLYIPGTIPRGYGSAAQAVPPFKYPAYNEVLGLVALLNTPSSVAQFKFSGNNPIEWTPGDFIGDDCQWRQDFTLGNKFSFRFTDKMQLAFNQFLEFDFSNTKTYVLLEIEIENHAWDAYYPKILNGSNMHLIAINRDESNDNILNTVYQSEWIDYSLMNQMVFSVADFDSITRFSSNCYYNGSTCICLTDPEYTDIIQSKIKTIKVKLMNDMYFNQIGSNLEQMNTTQVSTFMLYGHRGSKSVNDLDTLYEFTNSPPSGEFDQYIPGVVKIDSTNNQISPNHQLITAIGPNGELYIDAEYVNISAGIVVAGGYELIIRALNAIWLKPGVELNPNVHLQIKRDYYSTPEFVYATDSIVHNYCSDSQQYHANIAAKSMSFDDQPNHETIESIKSPRIVKNKVSIHPNPATDQIWVSSSSKPISEIQIFDLSGRSLIHKKTDGANSTQVSLNVNTLQSGVYIVQTVCGDERGSEKLVIGK